MKVNGLFKSVMLMTILAGALFCRQIAADGKESLSFTTTRLYPDFPSRVNCLFPEKDGYIWLGTRNGLYRFDGDECRRFSSIVPGHEAFDNRIIDVKADTAGHVWALSDEGLLVYDRASDTAAEFSVRGSVTCPYRNGFVIGDEHSIYRFDFNTMKLEPVISFKDGFNAAFIKSLPDGDLLCGSHLGGLRRVRPDTRSVEATIPVEGPRVTSMFVDSRGRIWLGQHNHGVRCLDTDGNLLAAYSTKNSSLSNNIVLSFLEKDGRLWMATDGGGICILSLSTGEIECLENRVGDENSIPYNSILSIIPDSFGNIWAIRVRGGAFIIRDTPARTFRAVPSEKFGLSDNGVLCTYQEKGRNDLWIGTDGGGVNLYQADKGEFRWFPSTFGMKVADIAGFSDRLLMISSYSDGLFLLDKTDGSVSGFTLPNQDMHHHIMYSGNAMNLHDETSGTLLLLSRSVYRYDPKSRQARELTRQTAFYGQPTAVRGFTDRSFIYDSKRIYGVYPDSDSVETLHEVPPGVTISNVSHSGKGLLWIATDKGVYHLDLSSGESSRLDSDRQSASTIVVSDGRRHVWIGTHSSLLLWDEERGTLRDYDASFYAPQNELRPKAALASPDGNIYLGGMDGLLVIDGNAPNEHHHTPRMIISDVYVDSERIPGMSTGDNLKVRWTTSAIDINVHAKGDDPLAKRVFLFRVNGRDTIRQDSPRLTMRNIHPGKYSIDIACISSDGTKTPWSRALNITIPPPWYKSRTFFLLLALTFAAALVSLCARWSRNVRKNMKEEIEHIRQESDNEAFLMKLNYCIQLHLGKPEMDISMICRELGISHTALFNKVKQITGVSIKEHIDRIRLERSEEMVKNTDLSFTEIAALTGFTSSRYFSTFFKRKTGKTPSECRMAASRQASAARSKDQ